ncbi:MAG TPA: hypothetical protein VMV83_01350 [Rectinemataceae bacterium]|nr:hypothetical protein [Rectinemataceae bacterium]
MDFQDALKKFAASFNLYINIRDGVYFVSKVDARYDEATGLASLQAEDVQGAPLLRAFSKAIGKTILHDDLPQKSISIHATGLSPAALLAIVAKSYPDFSLETADSYFYLRHADAAAKTASANAAKTSVLRHNGGLYSFDGDRASFQDILTSLFASENRDYSFLTRNDTVITGLKFHDRSFTEALSLILEQANADCTLVGNTYYIFEIQRKDILKKLKMTVAIPIENMSAADIPALLPPDYVSTGMLRIDRTSNTVYLSGSLEEVKPVQDFIKQIDVKPIGRKYVRIDLKQLKAKDILSALPTRFSSLSPIPLPDDSGFVALLSDGMAADLHAYIDLIDRGSVSAPIVLKFIKTEDLLKNLPPSASKENIIDGGNGSTIFFVGSEDRRRAFLEDLSYLDRPKAQIRYDLLVVQYEDTDSMNLTDGISSGPNTTSSTSPFSVISALSDVLKLNLNVISEFGYLFAATLQSGIKNNRAQVFADTTLFGTVGKDVKFQNTTTYRYLDTTTSSTGVTTSTTREISSGLIITLNSWISGDGMITTDLSATLSQKAADNSSSASSSATAPPTTSERVLSTNVHTPSGVPIVIGGLRELKSGTGTSKPSLLGEIPFLGKAFEQRADTQSDSEIAIYLVPYLTVDEVADGSQGFILEHLYDTCVKGY